ncbi:MAG: DNA-binding response regulator, partial [Anaerolineae bacterium]|nr:DNA-binding response regulator [Anaerolineae bacterium]
NELLQAIRAAARGEAYLHPTIAQMVLEMTVRGEPAEEDILAALTDREHEVLVLIAEGQTNQQIATTLGISLKTVDKHRANLLKKLNLSSRAALIRFAVVHGLTSAIPEM